MTHVRFAMVCDACGERGPEYEWGKSCSYCLRDVCPKCIAKQGDDPEDRAVCAECEREYPEEVMS